MTHSLFYSKPLIELESSFDFSSVPKIKLHEANVVGPAKKMEVPITNGIDFEGVLHTIREFNTIRTVLNYTKGEDLFTNFRLCLTGTAREEWDLLLKDPNKTVPAFDAAIASFKRAFMTSNTKANLIDYINTVVKPRNMAVHTFARRLQSLNRYANELPDEQNIPTLTDDQIKKAVFMAMPDRWQLALIQSGRELKDCTMNFLTEYMENQREFAIINEQRNKRHRETDQPVFPGHKYSHRHTKRSFRDSHFSYRNNHTHDETRKAMSNDQRYCSNDAPCPIHLEGKHKWGMCFLNPNGSNYKPGKLPATGHRRAGSPGEKVAAAKLPPHNGSSYANKKPRGGNHRGPTHQSYFQSDSDASGENSKYSSSDSTPLDRDSPSVERTQTDGGAHGWDNTPPGASLKDY